MSPLPSSSLADLNDEPRRHFATDPAAVRGSFSIMITQGVGTLDEGAFSELIRKVSTFRDFTPENDPFGEHDFGCVSQDGESYFWKIDYYDLHGAKASPEPTDPSVTRRVLTIMRADEY